jgi:hypothetical protein
MSHCDVKQEILAEREANVVAAVQRAIGDPKDQCYPASEAVYHLLGGKCSGLTPVRGGGHWWLRRKDGSILDVTAAQYPQGFDYAIGKGGGFLTANPSARAHRVMLNAGQYL